MQPSTGRDLVRAALARMVRPPGPTSVPTPYERSVRAQAEQRARLLAERARWRATRAGMGVVAGLGAWVAAVNAVVGAPQVGALVGAAGAAALVPAVRSHRRLGRHPEPAVPVPPPPRPQPGSAAAPAVHRVEQAAAALDALVVAVGDDVIARTALDAAVEGEEAVRRVAARVGAVESAARVGGAPGAAAAAGLPTLLSRLHEGVAAYERFAGTLTELVCAGPVGLEAPSAQARLDAAALELQARAHGLRVAAGV